ncbi:MAG: histidinol dehydrogenase [Magnetococcales bacterium]|nr:histidinol dehydrogenase [Magnetococcales bacterium]
MNDFPIRLLDTRDPRFALELDRLGQWNEDRVADIEATVADIIQQVRREGDTALARLTARFDRIDHSRGTLRFDDTEIDQAMGQCDSKDLEALELAARRIRDYHVWQMPPMGVHTFVDPHGTTLGQRLRPLDRVGLYVPGGLASYPSSVLMNAIPARVAGVRELVMTVPTPEGRINPLILAAARIAQVDEIHRIGGAQAIAALAFGTATLRPVDKIVGPGNIYVATAKRQVFGHVGIDMIAGPSEILIIADGANDPSWLAADLLSQAEHDASAQSILITDQADVALRVVAALEDHLATLQRQEICRKALADHGAIIIARSLEEACRIASRMAPEHLELAVAHPEELIDSIDNAGAIFLGRFTPEPIGDYIAGPNHVLPTSRTARFSSPLGVHEFIKRSSIIGCTRQSLEAIGPAAARLAAAEGLTAHQRSIDIRLKQRP